jgi:hypothetical protein
VSSRRMIGFERTGHRERLSIGPGLAPSGERVRLADRGSALALLRDLGKEAWGMGALRRIYAEVRGATSISAENDRTVLEELARRLVTGELKAHRVQLPAVSVPHGGEVAEPAPAKAPARSPAAKAPVEEKAKATAFVEIALLDDSDPPQPVPFMRFQVELPDGTIIEGQTDASGAARVDGLPKGTVKVSFPDLHGEDWSPA